MTRRTSLVLLVIACALPFGMVSAQEGTPEAIGDLPFDTLPEMPSEEAIEAARDCDTEAAPDEPETPCEWAAVAASYSRDAGDGGTLPAEGIESFVEAVTGNPALAFTPDLLFGYIGQVDLVPSPFEGKTITDVEIDYSYAGLGASAAFHITISEADTDEPVVAGEVQTEGGFDTPEVRDESIDTTVDSTLVQALSGSLTDLMPMGDTFTSVPCWDNYPDWTVTLTFDDGTTLDLATYQSNFFFAGGPWQLEIDGQIYAQYSFDFLSAILDITEALDLPLGETAAMGCGGLEPFEDAYPGSVSEGTEEPQA
jgi:hypothetical protein